VKGGTVANGRIQNYPMLNYGPRTEPYLADRKLGMSNEESKNRKKFALSPSLEKCRQQVVSFEVADPADLMDEIV